MRVDHNKNRMAVHSLKQLHILCKSAGSVTSAVLSIDRSKLSFFYHDSTHLSSGITVYVSSTIGHWGSFVCFEESSPLGNTKYTAGVRLGQNECGKPSILQRNFLK